MNAFPRLGLLLALAFAGSAAAASVPSAQKIEAEVTRVDADRIAALLKQDLPALERLFSDKLVYVHSGGRVDSKANYLASLAAGNLTYVSLRYDPPAVVRAMSDDTVVATGRANIEARNKAGQVTKRVLTTTTVYVRTTEGWQVVSYQGTPVQP
jgi:ketosteroid isomerase-like protein